MKNSQQGLSTELSRRKKELENLKVSELSLSSLSYRRENKTKKNEQSLKDPWASSVTPTYTLGEFQKGEEGEKGLERTFEETRQKTSHGC